MYANALLSSHVINVAGVFVGSTDEYVGHANTRIASIALVIVEISAIKARRAVRLFQVVAPRPVAPH